MSHAPFLSCPCCGADCFQSESRGRFDRDGNFIAHAIGCRCRWCEWMWWDDAPPVRCECGALVGVEIDDDHAHAVDVWGAQSDAYLRECAEGTHGLKRHGRPSDGGET